MNEQKTHPTTQKKINDSVFKVMVVGKERSGKDLFILKNIYDYVKTGKFTIDPFLKIESLYNYPKINEIWFNGWLDKKIFKNYNYLKTELEFKNIKNSIVWISDADIWFNSRITYKGTDKEQQILDVISSQGKNMNFNFFSAKRPKNTDIKIRTLCNFKIECKKLCGNIKNCRYLKNWLIYYKVFDEYDDKIGESYIKGNDLIKICDYYNTNEKVNNLIKNLQFVLKVPIIQQPS